MKKANQNVIYMKMPKGEKQTRVSFPYPPLYRENNTDYICFTDREDVHSDFWKVQRVENIHEVESSSFLTYKNVYEVLPNQIIFGAVFDKDSGYVPIIDVPELDELSGIPFDAEHMVHTSDEKGNYQYKKNPVYTGGRYDGRELLLTIGVPVSNQIATIERCLSGIRPLLERLPSELLVIDTGSTDGTLDVCKRYGARIITFPWCDNMSAVRNAGIFHAKGEWYLSIDDDEWFEDVDAILEFFCSGMYRKYDMASYVQRNYLYKDKKEIYTDMQALRMAKIVPELHFEGRIHDALHSPRHGSIICLSSYANHEGFAKDNMTKVFEKCKRNVSKLIYDVWEYPRDLRYRFQLANEFLVVQNYPVAVSFFVSVLSMEKQMKSILYSENSAIGLLETLYEMVDVERYFAFANLLKECKFTDAEKAFIAFMKADLYFRQQRCQKEVLDSYEEWEKYKEQYDHTPEEKREHSFSGEHVCVNIPFIMDAHTIAFCTLCQQGRESEAIEKLQEISVEHILNKEEDFWECFLTSSDRIYEAVIQKIPQEYMIAHKNEMFDCILDKMTSDTAEEDCLKWLQRILNLVSIEEITDYMKQGRSIRQADTQEKLIKLAGYSTKKNIFLQTKFFFARFLQTKIMHREAKEHDTQFKCFVYYMGSFAAQYYAENLLENQKTLAIDPVICAAYEIYQAIFVKQSLEQKVHCLKKAVIKFPGFKSEVENYLNELLQEKQHRKVEAEMQQLYAQLIEQAEILQKCGKKEEAEKIMDELAQMFPTKEKDLDGGNA